MVWVPTPGRLRPAPGGRAGGECGRGSPLPLWGPGEMFENSDAKSCILVASIHSLSGRSVLGTTAALQ